MPPLLSSLGRSIAGIPAHIGHAIKKLCNEPDHLQRLAIIAAGISIYPLVLFIIHVIRSYVGHDFADLQITIFGNALYICLGLLGLVIIALLGIIRGVKAQLPGGAGIEVQLSDSRDHDHDHDYDSSNQNGKPPVVINVDQRDIHRDNQGGPGGPQFPVPPRDLPGTCPDD